MKKKLTTMTLASILAASLTLPIMAEAAQSAEIKASVSFREGPSTSANVMRYLSRGEDVTVLKEVNAYWYQVQDRNGATGYISSSNKYVQVGSAAAGSPSISQKNTATAVASVSFRKKASVSGERMRYLSKGEVVTVLSQPNSYWYEIQDAKGVRGYVSTDSKYIKLGGALQPSNPGSGSGGSGNSGSSVKPPAGTSAKIEAVIKAGNKYLGTPYEYGSNRNSTKTFDCSDFVRRVFIEGAGITLPSDSRQQGSYVKNKGGVETNWRNLKRGDLMFFMSYKGTSASAYNGVNKSAAKITHVGIYLGDGKIMHTYSKESGGVRTDSIAGKHWEHRFLFGGSAL